jgi:hypothetical protein
MTQLPMFSINFSGGRSDRLRRLYMLMAHNERTDVSLTALHNEIYADTLFVKSCATFTPRDMQQRIGPYITRVNRILAPFGWHIVPGVVKQTYRLIPRG